MKKSELRQIVKIVELIVKQQINSQVKPLHEEINQLKRLIPRKNKPTLSETINSMIDYDDIPGVDSTIRLEDHQPVQRPVQRIADTSPLGEIFETIKPFSAEEISEADQGIPLDIGDSDMQVLAESNPGAAMVLDKIMNTDFRATLKKMEKASDVHRRAINGM